MNFRWTAISLFLLGVTMAAVSGANPSKTLPASTSVSAAAVLDVTTLALPGAPLDGVMLDYLAVDRARHSVWVPAGGTGNTVVIDTKTQGIRRVEKFQTKEVER